MWPVLVGQTGVGKSELALEMAREQGWEIISCDAMLVYRGFDIGTAKPSCQARAEIAHHLIDIRDPWETYSSHDFWTDLRNVLATLRARGTTAVLVGGTGLYLHLLRNGLAASPAPQAECRARLEARAAREGPRALWQELAARDPASSHAIHPNNVKRVIRALEIVELSGKPKSAWDGEARGLADEGYDLTFVGLHCEPSELDARLQARLARMFEEGLVEEVRRLMEVTWSPTAREAIGYAEVRAFLQGEVSLEQARKRMLARTRRLVKKQRTWFRAMPDISWVPARGGAQAVAQALAALR